MMAEAEGSADMLDFDRDSEDSTPASGQDVPYHSHPHDSLSPESAQCVENNITNSDGSKKIKLQLPMSCDPPGPGNKTRSKVWVVSVLHYALAHSFSN